MSLVRTAKNVTHAPGQGPEGGGLDLVQGTDVQRADQDDDLALETRGAPRVHAGNAAAPETADALAADPEIEKKTNLQRKDPRLHLKATAQQEDHAASVGDAGGVAAPVDLHPGSLPREFLGLHHLEDIRRKRSGIRKETETAEVIKTAAETTVITPAARKREVKTKTEKEIRRGS